MYTNTNLLKAHAKIMRLTTALCPAEWKRLGDFVRSPFFNRQEKVTRLYELLYAYFPFQKDLYKTDLLPCLGIRPRYPKEYQLTATEDAHLRRIIHAFCVLVEDFIVTLKQQEFPRQRGNLLARSLMERKAYALVPPIIKREKQKLSTASQYNAQYYYDRFCLEEVDFHMEIIQNNRAKQVGLQPAINSFVDFFYVNILLFFNAALTRQQILAVNYRFPLGEEIKGYLSQNWTLETPLVQVYYKLWELQLGKRQEEDFNEVIMLMRAQEPHFDNTTIRQVYSVLINHCILNSKRGKKRFLEEKLKLYQHTLALKIWASGLYFSAHQFLHITLTAVELGELAWAKGFVDEYSSQLDPKYLPEVPCLALADWHYQKKELEEAKGHLQEIVDQEDFIHFLNFKIIKIKIYYDEILPDVEKERQLVFHELNALKTYLSRQKEMTEANWASYNNFMKLTRRLFNIKLNFDYKGNSLQLLERLKRDVEEVEYLEGRWWLLRKVGEVVKSGSFDECPEDDRS